MSIHTPRNENPKDKVHFTKKKWSVFGQIFKGEELRI
jgi:hypothetical protein